jgi:hypothetical protein
MSDDVSQSNINENSVTLYEKRCANLKPFKPGQTGNPLGKPKGRLNMTTMLRALLETETVDEFGNVNTHAALINQALAKKAASGDTAAIKEVYERIDGKTSQVVEIGNKDEIAFKIAQSLGKDQIDEIVNVRDDDSDTSTT